MSPTVAAALSRAGFPAPAHIQARSVPRILSGGTAVVAAETGSGKTLSYVVPVVDTVVRLAGPQPAAAVDKRNHDPFSHGPKALILLPTGILCDQARHCRGQQDRRVCARSHRVRHSPSLARSNPRRLSA